MTERLLAARARLTFWRRPAAPAVATGANAAETPAAPTASPPPPAESQAGAAAAADTPVTAAPADATDPAPSRLVRWLARLRRRPAGTAATEAHTPAGQEGEDAGMAARPAPSRRVLAVLARKPVWMSAVGVAVLALIGTLGVMLWQAGQRNAALQARLAASEKRLAPAGPAPATRQAPAVAAPTPAESTPAEPRIADAGPVAPAKPAPAGGECDIGSREGVTLHLKDCIDAFNQGRARAGHASR
ncbi:MAG: hypothetical protein ACOY5S_11175 [Pseudomonadota bacterium]